MDHPLRKNLGRPKGTQNVLTNQAREAAARILDSAEYLLSLKTRANAGTLPPPVEILLWHYRYGKPKDQIVISQEENLTELTTEELALRAKAIAEDLDQAKNLATLVMDEAATRASGSAKVN